MITDHHTPRARGVALAPGRLGRPATFGSDALKPQVSRWRAAAPIPGRGAAARPRHAAPGPPRGRRSLAEIAATSTDRIFHSLNCWNVRWQRH